MPVLIESMTSALALLEDHDTPEVQDMRLACEAAQEPGADVAEHAEAFADRLLQLASAATPMSRLWDAWVAVTMARGAR